MEPPVLGILCFKEDLLALQHIEGGRPKKGTPREIVPLSPSQRFSLIAKTSDPISWKSQCHCLMCTRQQKARSPSQWLFLWQSRGELSIIILMTGSYKGGEAMNMQDALKFQQRPPRDYLLAKASLEA